MEWMLYAKRLYATQDSMALGSRHYKPNPITFQAPEESQKMR